MRLLVDAQLPPALARWLTVQGHDARHVFDLSLIDAADATIWQHAIDTSAAILTKDEDFAVLAQLRDGGPPIVWVRYGNVRKAELLHWIEAAWPGVVEALGRGESLIELT